MPLKQFLIKVGRLYLIAAGVITTTVVVGIFIFLSLPTFRAIGWHIKNGNSIGFQSHRFHVPLTWNCEINTYRKHLELSTDHPLIGGASIVSVERSDQFMDSAAAHAWQQRLIASLNQRVKSPAYKSFPRTIQGKNMEYVCLADNPNLGDSLNCRISNTNLSVSVMATGWHHEQAVAILQSAQ